MWEVARLRAPPTKACSVMSNGRAEKPEDDLELQDGKQKGEASEKMLQQQDKVKKKKK